MNTNIILRQKLHCLDLHQKRLLAEKRHGGDIMRTLSLARLINTLALRMTDRSCQLLQKGLLQPTSILVRPLFQYCTKTGNGNRRTEDYYSKA